MPFVRSQISQSAALGGASGKDDAGQLGTETRSTDLCSRGTTVLSDEVKVRIMTEQESILATLAKPILHEKSARSIGSVDEAEAFAAKIQALMFKHKLEMTDIKFAEQEKNEPVLSERLEEEDALGVRRESTRRQRWVDILVGAVAKANFCQAACPRGNNFYFFGRATDLAAAKAMIQYLYAACLEALPLQSIDHSENKCTFNAGFKLGFAMAIAKRLRVQRTELAATLTEKGLIRIDQVERAVAARMKMRFPYVTTYSVSTSSQDGLPCRQSLRCSHRDQQHEKAQSLRLCERRNHIPDGSRNDARRHLGIDLGRAAPSPARIRDRAAPARRGRRRKISKYVGQGHPGADHARRTSLHSESAGPKSVPPGRQGLGFMD